MRRYTTQRPPSDVADTPAEVAAWYDAVDDANEDRRDQRVDAVDSGFSSGGECGWMDEFLRRRAGEAL